MASYWDRVLNGRVSRRRALAASGAAALGGAILSACGGDEEGGAAERGIKEGGLVYNPVNLTKEGPSHRGGTIKSYITNSPASFDVHNWPLGLSVQNCVMGSQLTRFKAGVLENPPLASEGDLAEKWEYTPDHLTLTMKLHPQAKWSPLSPSHHAGVPASVGGRVVDADDVLFSWEKFKNQPSALGRNNLVNDVKKSAPVQTITKIDNSTIQFKLARPNAGLIQELSIWDAGRLYILPKEGKDNGIDFSKSLLGAGAYYIDKFEPSTGMFLKRNPYFELRDERKRPFADAVDLPLIQDPSQVQAQLRVGNVWHLGLFGLRAEDILKLKQDVPDLLLTTSYNSDPELFYMGFAQGSPWNDVRVRQALSYAWDRDAFLEIVHKISALEAAGVATDARWNAGFPCNETGYPNGTYEGFWLDPKSKEFGENAKYFTLGDRQKDIAEAKALLKAATGKDTLDFEHYFSFVFATTPYSIDVLIGVMAEAGFKGTSKRLTVAEFGPIGGAQPPGNHQHTAVGIDGAGSHHPGLYVFTHYHKDGPLFRGFNPSGGSASADGDPTLNDFAEKMLAEFDEKKLQTLAHDFSRYSAKMNYRPRYPGGSWNIENPGQGTAYGIAWPVLQNQNVYTGTSFRDWWTTEFIDETKPPVNKKA